MTRIENSEQLKDFVRSVQNLNPDWHEGSDFVEAVVTGTKLDNEGNDNEIVVTIFDKKTGNQKVSVKLATLLSFVTLGGKSL